MGEGDGETDVEEVSEDGGDQHGSHRLHSSTDEDEEEQDIDEKTCQKWEHRSHFYDVPRRER